MIKIVRLGCHRIKITSVKTPFYKTTIKRRNYIILRAVLNRMHCTTMNHWEIKTVNGNRVKSKVDYSKISDSKLIFRR